MALTVTLAAGCGSRLSHARLLADARSGGAATSAGTGSAADASNLSGVATNGGTGLPGSNGSVGASVASSTGSVGGAAATGGTAESSASSGSVSVAAGCSSARSPIAIGAVGEQTGIVGGLVRPQIQAVQAWVTSMNAHGGLNCHPLRYIVADDGGDPSRNQSLTQQLVEQDHVLAFVNNDAALAGQASVGYVTQKQIPVVGTEGGEQWVYQSPMYFPQQSSGDLVDEGTFAALGYVGRLQGKTKLATVSCVEASVCSAIYNQAATFGPKFGMSVVYRGQASLAQPDFTSNCQAAQSAGAQLFLIGLDSNSAERVARSCSSVNYHPIFAVESSVAQPQLAYDTLLDGLVVGMPVLPWFATSNPAVVQFQNVLGQYAPGIQPNSGTIVGWVSAKLFELATRHLSEPPTSQSILDGLWSMTNNDLGGLTYPLTYTRNQNAPEVFCTWFVQLKGGQWFSPNGSQRVCA